jgi:hypothetical protein
MAETLDNSADTTLAISVPYCIERCSNRLNSLNAVLQIR